jgi:hypothetical protein
MTIPAVFPIGKTQWRKWTDIQRGAFNRARADGLSHHMALKVADAAVAPAPAPAPPAPVATEKTETVAVKAPPTPRKPRTKKA